MIALADQEDDGKIELEEFLQLMVGAIKDKMIKTQYVAQFKVYDKNQNGFISSDEIMRVTHILSPDPDVPLDEIETLIVLADTNGDGQIDYDEYAHMIMDKEKYLHYNFDFLMTLSISHTTLCSSLKTLQNLKSTKSPSRNTGMSKDFGRPTRYLLLRFSCVVFMARLENISKRRERLHIRVKWMIKELQTREV